MFHNKNANFVNGVTINIKDKETIKTFYENVLGFNLINESETAVQFEVGIQINLLLLLKYRMDENR